MVATFSLGLEGFDATELQTFNASLTTLLFVSSSGEDGDRLEAVAQEEGRSDRASGERPFPRPTIGGRVDLFFEQAGRRAAIGFFEINEIRHVGPPARIELLARAASAAAIGPPLAVAAEQVTGYRASFAAGVAWLSLQTFGDPDLRAGRTLELSGVDHAVDGVWRVSRVEHSWDAVNGHRCALDALR